jgi:pyridoxamine--pyruvate transaminase
MNDRPVLNLTTGPVDLSARTMRDQARPVLFHYDPAFLDFFAHTCELARQVFRTAHDVIVMQGEAMLALEAAAASLIAPGDTVLNLVSGIYGKDYEASLKRQGAEVLEIAVPYNDAIEPEAVRATLSRRPGIKFLSVVHVETPSGTVNPVRDICRIAREHDVTTIVDVVSSLGAEPLLLEDWGIDLAVAGSQKALGGVPGLAPVAVSPRAWEVMERKPQPLRGSYLSILDWRTTWLERRRFPHAPSVSAVYALESGLSQVLAAGVDRWVARHAAIARAWRAGLRGLGLEPWPARDAIAASSVTTARLDEGIADARIQAVMRSRYGVMISASEGDLAGRVLRLGHMATSAHPTYLAAGLSMLERALADLGRPARFGEGVGAALAALDDWDDSRDW